MAVLPTFSSRIEPPQMTHKLVCFIIQTIATVKLTPPQNQCSQFDGSKKLSKLFALCAM